MGKTKNLIIFTSQIFNFLIIIVDVKFSRNISTGHGPHLNKKSG